VSAADVETLRRMFEELVPEEVAPVQLSAVERWWDPELTYLEDPRWPGSTEYRGRERVLEAWNSYLEILGGIHMGIEGLIDAGDQVVAMVRITGSSKGAEVPFDHLWAYVLRLRDGKLVYWRAYWEPDEGLAAAGASSP
jgi:ketosteroid isomerase-like protein